MTKPQDISTQRQPRTLLIAVHAPYNPTSTIESYYEEFVNLAHTNAITQYELIKVKLRTIDPAYFFTAGKLDELTAFIKNNTIERVIISEPLAAQQERNLSTLWHADVIDRTALILEIFERGAQSAEGKTQVAIAVLQYKKARLTGRGISMSQQTGFIGTRGPGETAKEKELQHLERLISSLQKELERIEKTRATQRKQRLLHGTPLMCLIGYTNAGKSTILNKLTKSDVLAENKLFATLDTTTRELYINSKKKALISDTVGFIQLLPHTLIEAFKSTLSELQYADLLLQVIDISDLDWKNHIAVVNTILTELQVQNKPMLYIFNKADKILLTENLKRELESYQPYVVISALSKEGIAPLVTFLQNWHPDA